MNHLFKSPIFNGSPEEQGQGVSEMLEKELAKPYKKRDYDKIEELLNEYTRRNGMEEQIQKASEIGIQRAIAKTKTGKLRVRKYRPLLTAVCLAVVMAIFNTISVVAFDMNAFSFIVHVVDNGFSVDFFSKKVPSESVIQIPVSEDDPYGMIAECAKNGIYPETPHYLPDGLFLIGVGTNDLKNFEKYVMFNFISENNQKISFSYHAFDNSIAMQGATFPNDEHNFQEIKVNGHPALLAEEKKDKEFTLVYCCDDLLMCHFSCWNISESEVKKIIDSFY